MAAVLAAQLDRWQPTCITYLPLGFLRARERGYNQAELLARPIAQSLSMPCVSALRKRPFTAVSPCSRTPPPPEECRRLAPARARSARRRARRGHRRYRRDRLDRPQTPRTSCAAWAPPVFSYLRPQKPWTELFFSLPLFTFFRLFFIILIYCRTFFCRLWQYRQMRARISGNFIDFSLASDAAIWYDRRA